VVTINTAYEKVGRAPVRMSLWTITQLASPDRVFILLPRTRSFRKVVPKQFRQGRAPRTQSDPATEARKIFQLR
jgi:hypothetical protein